MCFSTGEAQAEEILRAKSKNGVDFARFERWFQSTVKVIAGGFPSLR